VEVYEKLNKGQASLEIHAADTQKETKLLSHIFVVVVVAFFCCFFLFMVEIQLLLDSHSDCGS